MAEYYQAENREISAELKKLKANAAAPAEAAEESAS